MSEAFGKDWQSLITLDPNPVGAGSVAQVRRGFIHSHLCTLLYALSHAYELTHSFNYTAHHTPH
jgi:predicted unusual protein kinase regulating ubiquinone biosynthesis (AarF/ABC1/UbiB family)